MFREKVAIVTGASSGIGRQTAIKLGDLGGRVVVADIVEEPPDGLHGPQTHRIPSWPTAPDAEVVRALYYYPDVLSRTWTSL